MKITISDKIRGLGFKALTISTSTHIILPLKGNDMKDFEIEACLEEILDSLKTVRELQKSILSEIKNMKFELIQKLTL